MFGWGIGFYGPGIYLVSLKASHGWSTLLISSAVTGYYLLSATLIIFIGGAFDRFGPRHVVLFGSLAMAAGVVALTVITAPWQVYVAFLIMSVGWASMSGAAINIIIAPWFEQKRGLAVSLALNGASFGGVLILPFLVFLITRFGFAQGLYIAVGTMLVVMVPIVMTVLHKSPRAIGMLPDGRQPAVPEPAEAINVPAAGPAPWRRTLVLRQFNFWTISIPFALGLAAQVGFLTHQVSFLEPALGRGGAALAVSVTTLAAVVGRVVTGVFIDRLNRRLVSSANFVILRWTPVLRQHEG